MLCWNEEWFSDDFALNIGSKELIERTLGKWIIEASDLAGSAKRKSSIKSFDVGRRWSRANGLCT